MPTLTVEKDALGRSIDLHYEDIGYGPTVVLVHGWPFEHGMWESQCYALASGGCRVIAYDQRGFGRSSKPLEGYHYNRLSDDLRILLDKLDLRDVVLVGFSMGAAQAVYYMSRHLGQRVRQVALVSSITPSLPGNGFVDTALPGIERMAARAGHERLAMMEELAEHMFRGAHVSVAKSVALEWMTKFMAFPTSTKAWVDTALALKETDTADAVKSLVNVPTLVIHGTDDHVAPFQANGQATADMLPDCVFKPYDGAPHGLFVTHAERLGEDLLEFVHNPPSCVV